MTLLSEVSSDEEEELEARRQDMYLPKRERNVRKSERERERRRTRSRKREAVKRLRKMGEGEWEVHFVSATPTIWTPGARPRTYGEPVVRIRR